MDATLLALVEGRPVAGCTFDSLCRAASQESLEKICGELEDFRRATPNFYHGVRAIFFLAAIHRYYLPPHFPAGGGGLVPYAGHKLALARRFEEALAVYHDHRRTHGSSDAISSAFAAAYHGLAFKTLASQVQKTVRKVRGNQWMFRMGHPLDYPLRLRRELLARSSDHPDAPFPVLFEETAVRLDLSHAAWSDIFFLGMDCPEGAQVLNLSVNLGVHGRDADTRPPVCAFLRVIDEPVLRLISVDLGVSADLTDLADIFDFAKDYLGLLKAAVIASGVIPSGLEGSGHALADILATLVGPGRGLELVSQVRDIPKGSRLAVSTNLLGCLISLLMRATGQTVRLTGGLDEDERRTIASRAILGEWLGGSGGGWQDSGGVWPGIKFIRGEVAMPGDSEHGVSRGRLLPRHQLLGPELISPATRQALRDSLVLVHGGMSQNVGPILEMVTEKYLLGLPREAVARTEAQAILNDLVAALHAGDINRVATLTTRNFFGPLQAIIPWASNAYTERLVTEARAELGDAFRGFVMLGGMSGGGMGFWIDPARRAEAVPKILALMRRTKRALEHALPFAMDPVVYDFDLNENGSFAHLRAGPAAMLSPEYYLLMVPRWLRQDPRTLRPETRAELDRFASHQLLAGNRPLVEPLITRIFPPAAKKSSASANPSGGETLRDLLAAQGFDPVQHERIRDDLRTGRIGLAQNRLPASALVEDARPGDVATLDPADAEALRLGRAALAAGTVAVVTLAAGAGSRWTQGAGTVKALHPFAKLGGRHRSFIETHLAKTRAASLVHGAAAPHLFTTSHLTHDATADHLRAEANFQHPGPVLLSPGRSIGLRFIPTVRDLRFSFEEVAHQQLDPQKEKMRRSVQKALIDWAATVGEASDYTDNLPSQSLHPVGHWYEIANLLLNGTLRDLLAERPQLDTLLLHNIDTLGASLDPAVLGHHLRSGATLSFEVIRRRIEDRGGGLARINGQLRLVEGLALPRDEDEFALTYYNSATCWIRIDALLALFGLDRAALADPERVLAGVRRLAARMPTYVTLKDVKKRWGNGQEDIFPVAQFEKLWGDMTALPEAGVRFIAVPRLRGQQLKDQAQLDGWLRDGSAAEIEKLCAFPNQVHPA
jgi:hypothetical protein